MPDEYVIAATYATPVEAELARNCLEAEGISARLADDATVGWFWYLGNALGGVKLLVPSEQLDESLAILQSVAPVEASDVLTEAAPEHQCDACGASMDPDMDYCPVCEAANELRSDREAHLLLSTDAAAGDRNESPAPSLGDEMAFRALRAAVFGLIACPPLMHLYSLYCLLRLAQHSGEVSPTGMRYGLYALMIDTVVIVVMATVVFNPWVISFFLS